MGVQGVSCVLCKVGLQHNRAIEGKNRLPLGSLLLLFAFEKVQERKIYEGGSALGE